MVGSVQAVLSIVDPHCNMFLPYVCADNKSVVACVDTFFGCCIVGLDAKLDPGDNPSAVGACGS